MGQSMADMLVQKCGSYNVTVDVSSFEKWEPRASFKTPLIYSATAFHWIDEGVRYRKTHELLTDGGHLALLFNSATDFNKEEVKKAHQLLAKYHPERTGEKIDGQSRWVKEIADSRYFSLADHIEYTWKMAVSKEWFAKAFYSQSDYLSIDDEAKREVTPLIEKVFSGMGEIIESDYKTTIFLAKKK